MLTSITSFLVVRPLICLIILISIYSWGWAIQKENKEHLIRFSNGFYLSTVFIFIICLCGSLNFLTCSIFISLGFLLNIYFFINEKNKLFKISFKPNIYWLLAPYFLLLFIRCSTPPYFIDFLQYHLPYCYEVINAYGFKPLPHFFFATTMSNFSGESLSLIPLIFSTPETIVLFNGFLSVFILFYIKKICLLYNAESSASILIFLLLSCEIFFHNSIYGKTENTIILLILDILLRLKLNPFNTRFHLFSFGFALSFLPFFKTSTGIVFVLLVIWSFWTAKKSHKLNLKCISLMSLGAIIPLSLLILKNIFTHKMPLFPFIYDPDLLPKPFENGPSKALQAESIDLNKISDSIINLLDGQFSYGFSPGYLSWFLILGVILAILKKNYSYLIILFITFIHWQFWVLSFIFPNSTFRLTFPIWIIAIISLGILISKFQYKPFKNILLFLSILCYFQLVISHSKFLPGLRYHLGQQDLKTYYSNMSTPTGCIDKKIFSDLPKGMSIAISSELAGAFYHSKIKYVNLSNVFDKQFFKDTSHFIDTLKKENFYYIISDQSLNSGLSKWSKQAASESKLKIIDQINDLTIYQLN